MPNAKDPPAAGVLGTGYLTPLPLAPGFRARLPRPERTVEQGLQVVEKGRGARMASLARLVDYLAARCRIDDLHIIDRHC